jgi:hypothetical protein
MFRRRFCSRLALRDFLRKVKIPHSVQRFCLYVPFICSFAVKIKPTYTSQSQRCRKHDGRSAWTPVFGSR